ENKCRRDCQPYPKPWRAQISPRSALRQRVNVRVMLALEIESFRRESRQAIPQHSDKMGRVESDLFEDADREQRQNRPEKRCAPRPARNQEEPSVDRRMPERQRDQ